MFTTFPAGLGRDSDVTTHGSPDQWEEMFSVSAHRRLSRVYFDSDEHTDHP